MPIQNIAPGWFNQQASIRAQEQENARARDDAWKHALFNAFVGVPLQTGAQMGARAFGHWLTEDQRKNAAAAQGQASEADAFDIDKIKAAQKDINDVATTEALDELSKRYAGVTREASDLTPPDASNMRLSPSRDAPQEHYAPNIIRRAQEPIEPATETHPAIYDEKVIRRGENIDTAPRRRARGIEAAPADFRATSPYASVDAETSPREAAAALGLRPNAPQVEYRTPRGIVSDAAREAAAAKTRLTETKTADIGTDNERQFEQYAAKTRADTAAAFDRADPTKLYADGTLRKMAIEHAPVPFKASWLVQLAMAGDRDAVRALAALPPKLLQLVRYRGVDALIDVPMTDAMYGLLTAQQKKGEEQATRRARAGRSSIYIDQRVPPEQEDFASIPIPGGAVTVKDTKGKPQTRTFGASAANALEIDAVIRDKGMVGRLTPVQYGTLGVIRDRLRVASDEAQSKELRKTARSEALKLLLDNPDVTMAVRQRIYDNTPGAVANANRRADEYADAERLRKEKAAEDAALRKEKAAKNAALRKWEALEAKKADVRRQIERARDELGGERRVQRILDLNGFKDESELQRSTNPPGAAEPTTPQPQRKADEGSADDAKRRMFDRINAMDLPATTKRRLWGEWKRQQGIA
jgi:hypothetical protein